MKVQQLLKKIEIVKYVAGNIDSAGFLAVGQPRVLYGSSRQLSYMI